MEKPVITLWQKEIIGMSDKFEIIDGRLKKKMSIWWWTKKWSHLFFIGRELTSLCVAYTALFILFLIKSIEKGQGSYEKFMETLRSPFFILLHIIVLGGLLWHTISWLNLAPKAVVLKLGKKIVPGGIILFMNYAGWIVISAGLVWLLFGYEL